VRQLDIKVMDIIDARCNHEVYWNSSKFPAPDYHSALPKK